MRTNGHASPASNGRAVATVDGRLARLFRCEHTEQGSLRLTQVGEFRNPWEADHERRRPAILGRGPGTAPPHEAGFGHEEEEEGRRFARDVARWLARRAAGAGEFPIVVFAAPRFLGLLRRCAAELPDGRVRIVRRELTRLGPDELAAHPTVRGALRPRGRR